MKEKLQSLSGDVKERKVKREIEEIETLNIELDHRVTKLVVENEHLKQTYKQMYDSIKPSRVRLKEQCDDLIKQLNLMSAEISDLHASLQEQVLVITALKESLSKLKGKDVVNEAIPLHSIDPELLKIDVATLTPKLRKNRTAHTDYIRHTLEEAAATLREIVESERFINPLNTSLDYACKYTKRIQELLNILQQTCPCITNLGRVNLLSSASKSKSQDNKKNDRIQRTPRKAKKNKLEDHLRTIRPRLNKKSVVDTKATSAETNFMSNVNSDLKCVSCNGCLFSDNHDACVVAYINSVNSSIKSKYVKKPVNRTIWQTTGKIFTTVRHIWKPTERTFTLVGNVYPLTRLATTTIVPPREHIPIASNTDKPVITLVYTRKSKATNKRVPVSNSTMNKSLVVNKMEPNNSWGSSSSNVPSSLIECRSSKLFSELTNDAIRNSKAYKEYYAIATGEVVPKPKANVRRTKSSSDTSITPPTAAASPRLIASAKGKQTAKASKAKSLYALSEVQMKELVLNQGFPMYQLMSHRKNSLGTLRMTKESSSLSSQFVTSLLNPTLDVGMELIFETTSQFNVLTPTSVAPLHITSQPMKSSTIATTTPTSQAQILPTTIPSDIIQNLPSFGSLFRFDDRLRSLEQNFSKVMQIN
nr:hypothetical protein [Tanacetum cinerariifolium]